MTTDAKITGDVSKVTPVTCFTGFLGQSTLSREDG